jgi:hypothetical protein
VCSAWSVQCLLYSRQHRPRCGKQNFNPLLKSNENVVSVVWDHLMITASGGGMSNLQRLAVWKKDTLLGGLGVLMKMWIVLGRLSYGVWWSQSPKQVRVTDATDKCPQNSSEEPTSETNCMVPLFSWSYTFFFTAMYSQRVNMLDEVKAQITVENVTACLARGGPLVGCM